MARDLKYTYITSYPTYGFWFERFIIGMHKKMGDEVHQDQTVAVEVIHKLMERFKFDYSHSKLNEEKEGITDQAIFVLAAFLIALRGEEESKLVLGEARDYTMEAMRNFEVPHIVLPLRDIFKGETGKSFHFMVVTVRSNSKLEIGK